MFGDFFLRVFAWFLYFWMTVIHDFVRRFKQLEDYLDTQLLKTKPYLFDVARLCVLSTFIEDGFQKLVHWDHEREFMEEKWNCGWYFATLFVIYNILGQLLPAVLITSKKYVRASCGSLVSILVLQTVTYYIPWSWTFLIPNIAVGCSLWILFAVTEYEQRSKNIRADDILEKIQNQIQLLRRLYRVISWLEFGYWLITSYYYIVIGYYNFMTTPMFFVFFLITSTLISLKNFRYKLRIWSVAFSLWIFGINLWFNSSWNISNDDFMKFSFFQNTSLIGGLLLFVAYGTDGFCLEDLIRHE